MLQQQWIDRLVHYQYLADFFHGRRVLEIGCSSGMAAAFLAEHAQQVYAVDISSLELAQVRSKYQRPNLEFLSGEPEQLEIESSSIDLVLVPDLTRWITRGSFMPELRRVLTPEGLALFAVHNADRQNERGMGFRDLEEYLSQAFSCVKLFGDIPFHGSIVADFHPDDEIEPQLDSSLVEEDEAPGYYLGLCSDEPFVSPGYSVVQIPSYGTPLFELSVLREKFDELVEERAEAELKLEELRKELANAERRVLEAGVEARQELTALRRETREKQGKIELLVQELAQVKGELEEARSLQHVGERAVDEVVEELRQELQEQQQQAQLELRQAKQRLEQHVETSQKRIKQLEGELQRAQQDNGSVDTTAAALRQAQDKVHLLEEENARLRADVQAPYLDDKKRISVTDEDTFLETFDLAPGDFEETRFNELIQRLRGTAARVVTLEGQVSKERERGDRERDRAAQAGEELWAARSRAEIAQARAMAAEKTLEECRVAVEQQRVRAEGSERRCDSLVIRIEQGSAELSKLHQRIAELQGLRQTEAWQIDELTGKLREYEARLAGTAGSTAGLANGEAAALQQQIKVLGREKTDLEQQLAELQRQLAELEIQRKQYADVTADLEKKLMRSESRVGEFTRKATNAESKVVQLEVKLKRTVAEAATLSKWAEELREELKVAQGQSSIRPKTPEPEVAALRNDLREAQARIVDLESRCDRFMEEAGQAKAALQEKEARLEEALRTTDGTLLDELRGLRQRAADLERMEQQLAAVSRELEQANQRLRDAEQAETELARTRQDLQALRARVRDIDEAGEELERLRLEATQYKDALRELEQLRSELEETRIELVRAEEELRGVGAPAMPEESGWNGWEEEQEQEAEEYEGYVGAEMVSDSAAEVGEDGEESWSMEEELQIRERQLEALLEGAALHREEMERYQTRITEMEALIAEQHDERSSLEGCLKECEQQRANQRESVQQLREEVSQLGRDLARAQGELKRCEEERLQLGRLQPPAQQRAVGHQQSTMVHLQQELEQEARQRARLQEDMARRLSELETMQRQLSDNERALDQVRHEDTEHRAEIRELRRQQREVEERLVACQQGERRLKTLEQQLAEYRELGNFFAELEHALRAETQRLVEIERLLREGALAEQSGPATFPPSAT